MRKTPVPGGEWNSLRTANTCSRVSRSISPLGTETEMDVDLSDHGNPKDGTPITLWGKWEGENQVWKFQEAY